MGFNTITLVTDKEFCNLFRISAQWVFLVGLQRVWFLAWSLPCIKQGLGYHALQPLGLTRGAILDAHVLLRAAATSWHQLLLGSTSPVDAYEVHIAYRVFLYCALPHASLAPAGPM